MSIKCGGYFPHDKQTNKQTNKQTKKRETNMKIKNLAFFGIMAAIMGVAGTARADTTTVIASQAYVDAKDDLKQDNAKRIQTTKSAYDALEKSDDAKKEDYPSMYTLENSITAIGSDNFATKNLDNLTNTGKANVSAQGTYDSEATYVTGTVGKAIKDNAANIATNTTNIETINTTLQGKQDTLTFDSTPTADSTNPVTSGGVKTALDAKQDTLTFDNVPTANSNNPVKSGGVKTELDAKQGNLGGGDNAGKAVIATDTAGTVQYRTIATNASTAGSTDLLTAGAINNAIGNASTAVNEAFANNALDEGGLAAADNLAEVASIHSTVARQGRLGKAWSDEFDSTAATEGNATNLYNATTNATTNAKATPDNYVPTVAAVEKRLNGATTSDLAKLHDISATDTEINQLHSSGVTTSDLTKLHGVTADASELNILDGVTATTTEINKLAGLKADTTELNYVDGVTSNIQTQLDAKQGTITDGSVSATNGFVKSVTQTSGSVGGTTALGVYVSDMNNALKGVSSNSTAACTKGSPCTLTYYKDGTNEYMRWTPMDTESTDADTTAADRSNA